MILSERGTKQVDSISNERGTKKLQPSKSIHLPVALFPFFFLFACFCLRTFIFTCFCFATGVLNILFATGENIFESSTPTPELLVVRRGAFVERFGVFAVGVCFWALSFVIQEPRFLFCDANLFLLKSHSRIFSSQTSEAASSFSSNAIHDRVSQNRIRKQKKTKAKWENKKQKAE